MKEGDPERIEILPKVTGLINGRARSRSKTSRCSDSRSSLWVLLMVQSPETSHLRQPCLGFVLAKGVLTKGTVLQKSSSHSFLTAAKPEPCPKTKLSAGILLHSY